MNAQATRVVSEGPQLRTILLTDLVGSTSLVERLGDVPASELFREHDLLVLELQQRWRGRLIDRSDGLLLLFERAIDGLGFALDYTRGLREIGKAHGVEVQARAGLHVGEVLTWKNSDAAVQFGAKPLEVEGLAKPMAARLMTMARPGQILLSAMAEPLARRATRELGERGRNLLWKSYGRWRFKGIPEAHEVYEVGEVGIAPLRAPGNAAKAWRDVPLWRRPAALVAEVVLLAGLGFGTWFVTKPQPAIAFSERDWVVVGDLRNLTGQSVLDDSLAQAFRISLEQSRYVNVLSDMKARDTLARMQRKPGTPLDRAIASEIALRDGARAVILPTVSEIGGRVRISAEVVDPTTQTTVHAESADGVGTGSALGSIDKVTATLRQNLGEALASIKTDSTPLPQATTSNLDALRAYALGQKAYARGNITEASNLYQRATLLDPDFALAHLGSVRTSVSSINANAALPSLRKAIALRDRLPAREGLYLDAWAAEFAPGYTAPEKWKLLAQLYPDYFAGPANYAGALLREGRYAEAAAYATLATVQQNELRSHGFDYLGRAELGQENFAAAIKAFDHSLQLELKGSARRMADVYAAQSRFGDARKYLNRLDADLSVRYLEEVSFSVDQGLWDQADAAANKGFASNAQADLMKRVFGAVRGMVSLIAGKKDEAHTRFVEAANASIKSLSEAGSANRVDDAFIALSIGYASQRNGDAALAKRVLDELTRYPQVFDDPKVTELAEIVRAGFERSSGDPQAAIARLNNLLTGSELFQARVALMEAHAAAGEYDDALREAKWLAAHRGRAYIELGGGQALQALNVADTRWSHLRAAELQVKLRRPEAAQLEADKFLKAWSRASLPTYLRLKTDAVLPASKQ